MLLRFVIVKMNYWQHKIDILTYKHTHFQTILARDALARTNHRAIAIMFVRLSETGVHCDHTKRRFNFIVCVILSILTFITHTELFITRFITATSQLLILVLYYMRYTLL